jgi:hypothetical protein
VSEYMAARCCQETNALIEPCIFSKLANNRLQGIVILQSPGSLSSCRDGDYSLVWIAATKFAQ